MGLAAAAHYRGMQRSSFHQRKRHNPTARLSNRVITLPSGLFSEPKRESLMVLSLKSVLLLKWSASAAGTKRSWRCCHRMSVVRGEAENICSQRVFRLMNTHCKQVPGLVVNATTHKRRGRFALFVADTFG